MKALVKRIEQNADRFRKHFGKSLKHSCIDDCSEETYKNNVANFERATDRLRKGYDACNQCACVQEVLNSAACISAYIDPCTLNSKALADWNALRADLDLLGCSCNAPVNWSAPTRLAQVSGSTAISQ